MVLVERLTWPKNKKDISSLSHVLLTQIQPAHEICDVSPYVYLLWDMQSVSSFGRGGVS